MKFEMDEVLWSLQI